MCFLIKLCRHVSHGGGMNPIGFGGQRSKVKVTMDIYGNKLVNMIETKPLCISSSNLAEMLTMVRGWTLLIVEVKLGRHVNHMVTPIDFGGHSSKVKVTMGIIDKCGVRGDATLCVVIFIYSNMTRFFSPIKSTDMNCALFSDKSDWHLTKPRFTIPPVVTGFFREAPFRESVLLSVFWVPWVKLGHC